MSAGLILITILLLLPLIAGVGLMLSGRRAQAGDDAGPRCGGCGYNLTGAAANRCPECGALFIEAGVVIHGARRKRRRFYAGLALCLLTLVLVGPLSFTILLTLQAQARAVAARQAAVAAQQAAVQRAAAVQAFLQSTISAADPNAQAPASQPADRPGSNDD